MSDLDRHTVHDEVADRIRVLDDVRRIPLNKWLDYAEKHSLPTDPGRCSTAHLKQARSALYPQTAPGGASTTMALKKTPAAPAAKATPKKVPGRSFLIAFPEGKPNKAVASVLTGDAPETPAKTHHLVATSAKDITELPMQALLALVNAGKPGTPIRQFSSQDTAAAAAWDAILARTEAPSPEGKAPTPPKVRALKLVSYPVKAETKEALKQVRVGTKIATALDLLSRDGGVTLTEFENTLSQTGKPISARSWLGYDVNSVTGYGVKSEMDGDDLRLFLTYPKGMRKPLPHLPAKVAPAPKAPKAPKSVAPKSEVE